mmetsp:Transcript_11903/g.47971  ORF Transcript_11903/g.47971 Transcript_11903/m.47971 type:complete len:218 (+) Transcript_11903:3-656(+)
MTFWEHLARTNLQQHFLLEDARHPYPPEEEVKRRYIRNLLLQRLKVKSRTEAFAGIAGLRSALHGCTVSIQGCGSVTLAEAQRLHKRLLHCSSYAPPVSSQRLWFITDRDQNNLSVRTKGGLWGAEYTVQSWLSSQQVQAADTAMRHWVASIERLCSSIVAACAAKGKEGAPLEERPVVLVYVHGYNATLGSGMRAPHNLLSCSSLDDPSGHFITGL